MPKWGENRSSSHHSDDPQVAKAATDLARLIGAAQSTFASLGDLLSTEPRRFPPDLRVRISGVQELGNLLITQAQQLTELLEAHGRRREQ